MPWYARPAAALSWLGRQGTRAVALSLFAGLALPWLAAAMKPLFTPSVFVLLCLAFLRVDPAALRRRFARPGLVLAATAWMMIATPLACGPVLAAFGLERGVQIALTFQVAAPPVIATSALAALMGLDAALALAVLAACVVATPMTAAAFAALFLGASDISALGLGVRLFAMLAGAAAVAMAVRYAAGQPRVERQSERIDGLAVIALFVFAVAVMDGVIAQTIARPMLMLGLIALACATALVLGATTALVFWRAGRTVALTLALTAGLRNLGVMIAATGGGVPALTWLYIAMAQFPVYLLPHALKAAVKHYDSGREL